MVKILAIVCLAVVGLIGVLLVQFVDRPQIASLLSIVTVGVAIEPLEWEHGYQTSLVRATRYLNPIIGYNIGFVFPSHPYQSDRPELFAFIEVHGGYIYAGGGYPGAEMFVTFEGVHDRESANRKLLVLLAKLHDFVAHLK